MCQKQKEMLRPPGIEPESSTATIWRAYHYTTGAVPPARIELASSLHEGGVLTIELRRLCLVLRAPARNRTSVFRLSYGCSPIELQELR